ncbi:hypothetical protein RFX70_03530, partial [Acinetobacter baumannii]|nr:hypothetical protein [Acinetobacter baumannii]
MKDSMGLADIYIASGKAKQAKAIIDNLAFHSPVEYGVNFLYGNLYKSLGDYEKALYYTEQCCDISDSLANAQKQ